MCLPSHSHNNNKYNYSTNNCSVKGINLLYKVNILLKVTNKDKIAILLVNHSNNSNSKVNHENYMIEITLAVIKIQKLRQLILTQSVYFLQQHIQEIRISLTQISNKEILKNKCWKAHEITISLAAEEKILHKRVMTIYSLNKINFLSSWHTIYRVCTPTSILLIWCKPCKSACNENSKHHSHRWCKSKQNYHCCIKQLRCLLKQNKMKALIMLTLVRRTTCSIARITDK